MRAAARLGPRPGVQPRADEAPQQLVPRRVELHFVAPCAEAIERAQLRRVAVGRIAEREHLRRAELRAEGCERRVVCGRALARQGLPER